MVSEYEFEGKTTIFMYAAIVSVLMMAIGVHVMTPLAGLDGAAIGTLAGFGLYFFVVAFASHTWPTIVDILTGILGSLALFGVYQGVTYGLGSLAGALALVLTLAFYSALVMRYTWPNFLQKVVSGYGQT